MAKALANIHNGLPKAINAVSLSAKILCGYSYACFTPPFAPRVSKDGVDVNGNKSSEFKERKI